VNTWANVIEHEELGDKLYRLRLRAPQIAAQAKPGQFVMLKVRHGKDPLLARPFSIHGVEGEDFFILYRVVGRGTSILSLTRTGKSLAVWGPLGAGFDLNVENPILVAGGMGIAPLPFVAEKLVRQGKKPAFILGMLTTNGFEALVEAMQNRLKLSDITISWATEDGSLGLKGLVTHLLPDALKTPGSSVLTCGPMPMLKAVAKIAAEHNTPCQVSLEAPMACGIGVCLGCVIPQAGGGYLRACQEGPVLDAGRVDWGRL
jgi:dihydroorotate dehydrogenase electron transfer subunit